MIAQLWLCPSFDDPGVVLFGWACVIFCVVFLVWQHNQNKDR